MAVLLGLAVALSYGSADFLGGIASKRSSLASVVILSQVVGLPVLVVLALVVDGHPTAKIAALALLAGAAGGTGLTCLYRGLARGRMSVVAPITAVGAAVLPVAWGLGTGERPTAPALVGVALALVAVAFVSRIPGDEAEAAGGGTVLLLAAVGGIGFGIVFIVLGETGHQGGLWPLLLSRIASVTLLSAGALVTGRSIRPSGGPAVRTIVATGALDVLANGLYVFATQRGLLSLVAVLASLYPAATVVLARVVLAERLGRMQMVGLGLAATGVLLIAAG